VDVAWKVVTKWLAFSSQWEVLLVWLAPGFRCHNYSRFYCALAAHRKGNLEGVKRKKEKGKGKGKKKKEKRKKEGKRRTPKNSSPSTHTYMSGRSSAKGKEDSDYPLLPPPNHRSGHHAMTM
jgi:hypothetical protein